MTGRYAEGTSITVERSRLELEKLLRRFGADQFLSAWDEQTGRHIVAFRMSGRQIRLDLPVPNPEDPKFRITPNGKARTPSAARERYEAEQRRRWRALLLVVKAKLTAVADEISTLEREFLADVVLPNGATFGEWIAPQLEALDRSGHLPELLPGVTRTEAGR